MSRWLQEEMNKLEAYRKERTPGGGHIKLAVIVFVLIEAALLTANQVTPDYNMLPLCVVAGTMGLLIILIFASKSKTMPEKPGLVSAARCIEALCFSPEELEQFDAEMMAEPAARIANGNRADLPILVTAHYMAYAYIDMGEPDYRIYRLSDIAMTCYASVKNGTFDKSYIIDLINAKGEKIGGLSVDGKKSFTELNGALEKCAPDIQLNVSMKVVKKVRKDV